MGWSEGTKKDLIFVPFLKGGDGGDFPTQMIEMSKPRASDRLMLGAYSLGQLGLILLGHESGVGSTCRAR